MDKRLDSACWFECHVLLWHRLNVVDFKPCLNKRFSCIYGKHNNVYLLQCLFSTFRGGETRKLIHHYDGNLPATGLTAKHFWRIFWCSDLKKKTYSKYFNKLEQFLHACEECVFTFFRELFPVLYPVSVGYNILYPTPCMPLVFWRIQRK